MTNRKDEYHLTKER